MSKIKLLFNYHLLNEELIALNVNSKDFPKHLRLQQLDRDLAGHDLAHHVLVQQFPVLRVLVLSLLPQQVACRHVVQLVPLLDELALDALAGSSENEDDPRLVLALDVG
jgi:hypothetical protein